jgi:hypothetical protein
MPVSSVAARIAVNIGEQLRRKLRIERSRFRWFLAGWRIGQGRWF